MPPSEHNVSTESQYSLLVGLVYIFNLIVGTGALAIPKAFHDAGFALGIAILLCLGFFSYLTATFVIEALSAANAFLKTQELNEQLQPNSSYEEKDHYSSSNDVDDEPLLKNDDKKQWFSKNVPFLAEPVDQSFFEITQRIEIGHMSLLFLPRVGQIFFYGCLVLYLSGDLSIYATVVPKSLQHVICTARMNETAACAIENSTIPSISDDFPCWPHAPALLTRMAVYRILVCAFFLLLGPFVFTNVSKTKYLQFITTLSRWTAFLLMVGLTTIYLAQGRGGGQPPPVNVQAFGPLFGVCIYAFMCHHSLPGVITPIQKKTWLHVYIFVVFLLSLLFYSALALTGVFAFKKIQDVYTLNFQGDIEETCPSSTGEQIHPITHNVVIQYFLALFPVFTLCTTFPVVGITLRNNVRRLLFGDSSSAITNEQGLIINAGDPSIVVPGHNDEIEYSGSDGDSVLLGSKPPRSKFSLRAEQYLVPMCILIIPCCIALSTTDVELLVSITGSYAGVGVQYVLPAMLAYQVRKNLGVPVPKEHRSPFRSLLWVYVVFGLAGITVIVVTVNHVMMRS